MLDKYIKMFSKLRTDRNQKLCPSFPLNALCLNAFHDKAFETGLISIDENYHLMVSKKIRRMDREQSKMLMDYEDKKITLQTGLYPIRNFWLLIGKGYLLINVDMRCTLIIYSGNGY